MKGKERQSVTYTATMRVIKLINILMMTLAFTGAWHFYYSAKTTRPVTIQVSIVIIFIFLVLYTVFCRVYDALFVSYQGMGETVYSQILSFLITDGIMYLILLLMCGRKALIWPGLIVIAVQFLFSLLWSFAAKKWYFYTFPSQKTAIIFGQENDIYQLIPQYKLSEKFQVIKNLHYLDVIKDIDQLEGIETVFIRGVQSHERNVVLKYCIEHSINVFIIPRVGDAIMSGAKRMHLLHLPMLRVGRYNPNPEYVAIKRSFDILISAIAIIVLSPVFIITAIAVKSDGGPVLYKQKRLTKNGKEFSVLKFRSMRVDAEKDGVARLSSGDQDDRITRVGRIIRKLRVDELPQLLNVLYGSMSIVGPRPERPEIAEQYEEIIPEFHLRLQAKAGLTGYAQVYGKYNTTPYDKLLMDLMYIANPSIWEDLKVCFATVKILFLPESTEGVKTGQTTAMDHEDASDSTENGVEMGK